MARKSWTKTSCGSDAALGPENHRRRSPERHVREGELTMHLKGPLTSLCFALLLAVVSSQSAFSQYNISTVAGGGPNNLSALQSGIGYAASVVRDAAGNTYIADSYSSQILEVSAAGTLSVIGGNGALGYSGDGGPATTAALGRPESVALDSS